MKKRGRPPLPDAERKVRVVVYASAELVQEMESLAEAKSIDLSRLTERFYRRVGEFHRTRKLKVLET